MKNVGEAVSELSIIILPILKTLLFFFPNSEETCSKKQKLIKTLFSDETP